MFARLKHVAAALVPLALIGTDPAMASAVCDRLNTRLAQLPDLIATNADARDYASAISRQNIELRRAKNDRRRAGCNGGDVIVFDGGDADSCGALNSLIAEMEDNLSMLKSQREQIVAGGNESTRRRILASLEINGCYGDREEFASVEPEEPETHRNIVADLPPDDAYGPMLGAGEDGYMPQDGYYRGTLRTMCVRTCDGAFFPISSDATPADFPRDEQACRARCPGAETELYFHDLNTEESDQMVSAMTGRPYTEMPNAFAYRTRGVSKPGMCGCQMPQTAATDPKPSGTMKGSDQSSIVVIETKKPEAETNAVKVPAEERPYDPAKSKVRIVGPTYLPQQETSIDLKHPKGPAYQPTQSN
ncbi:MULTISPECIES: DUF2865 domain-containing protein [unclassified Ensifer]|uniref:DUF2865 domain-containing protein n=1 Tax=unclassified Ensifer TaxID=2633371 RepID=UPI000812EADA|nr:MULTISPECIES: DUF2865 domain-containing protein [unclassified Ensifer]OCP10277.1 hypothetical protein BC374_18730 [Ensifer sp. LC13]OCP11271.1 hypothetical protein BBX50_18935 [Ensifer sp. LC11]OCP14654.1 hypothetical protein BC362_00155 [Ensifer sp. LC14]OCP33235.1 hypothetical protein BC364_17830 [Ensifer sp. LC499]